MFFDEYREMFPEYSPIPPGEITEARRRREKKEQAAMEKIRKSKEVNVKTKKTK